MVFNYKKILAIVWVGVSILFTDPTFAQVPVLGDVPDDLANDAAQYDTGPSENDITIDFSPAILGAFQEVTLRTTSDYIDLNRYRASWYVDGKIVADGVGKRSITLKTRGYGQQTTVIVLIQLPTTLIKKTFSFEPQDMTVLWEALDSYTPPFYQGKKLPSREGIIKAVAIPNIKDGSGAEFNPKTGVYRWVRNGNVVGAAAGYGKDSFSFKNNKIRSVEEITVTASDVNKIHETTQTVTIPTVDPMILFYEKNYQTGITNSYTTAALNLLQQASIVVAEPYFFSTPLSGIRSLLFTWTMNQSPITLPSTNDQNIVTLQNSNEPGSATLGLRVRNPNSLFQSASSELPITIEK